MPNISKIKKKKVSKTKKLTNLPTLTKKTTKRVKTSPVDYYNCLLTQAQANWYDPTTGTKQKITACCKNCKMNAPSLNKQREQELNKLITSYQQVGASLAKLLKPIK